MKEKNLLLGLMILLLLSSCASRKKFVYLQDLKLGEKYKVSAKHEAVIHCDDRLSITVSSNQPELAIPFNVDNGMLKLHLLIRQVQERKATESTLTAISISLFLVRYTLKD